jgi:hypothetical protein
MSPERLDLNSLAADNSTMTTKLDLPEDLLQDLQRHASQHGQELSTTVTKLLRQGLCRTLPAEPASTPCTLRIHSQTGLPFIESHPFAPATRMSIAELLELELQAVAEDDLERPSVSL